MQVLGIGYGGVNMYIDLKYKPEDDIVVKFKVGARDIKDAAEKIAAESSVGTWTDVKTMNKRIYEMRARVFKIEKPYVWIAYPSILFESNNMPQILSSVAGNIFGMKAVKTLRVEDIQFPKSIVKKYRGPQYGIHGIRKLLGVKKRPLVGTIVKPKIGLHPKEHAKVAYNAWIGGLDLVKDDENLTSQRFNKFEKRIVETLKLRDKAERETGEVKIYMPNITAETSTMIERAKFVADHGGEYVMVDVFTAGFSALETIREVTEDLGLVIHAHRAMHAAITRNKNHGMTMYSFAKIFRLIGVDQLHTGTAVGKMEGGKEEVKKIDDMLREKWYNIKPTFPVASGGLHPGLVHKLLNILGTDIIIQAGGGVHGHPHGTVAGAKAMRQAVESYMEGIPLREYSKTHNELREALEKWSN